MLLWFVKTDIVYTLFNLFVHYDLKTFSFQSFPFMVIMDGNFGASFYYSCNIVIETTFYGRLSSIQSTQNVQSACDVKVYASFSQYTYHLCVHVVRRWRMIWGWGAGGTVSQYCFWLSFAV